jgi:hypothetical protein
MFFRLKTLIDENAHVLKHFNDVFQPYQQIVLDICSEFKDSVQFASNSEMIRNMNLFNPIYETNQQLSQPSTKPVRHNNIFFFFFMICNSIFGFYQLSPVNDSSAYLEMLTLHKYYDFIVFSFLACPSFLFQEKNLSLLQLVTDYRLFTVIYRDFTINIHHELEKVQTMYESTPTAVIPVTPKGYKLKVQLKNLSRNSLTNVPLKQRSRRLVLLQDLKKLNLMVSITPALIAPKFPVILSCCSMLKQEISHFFHHYPLSAEAAHIPYWRRDSKGYYKIEEYQRCTDIGSCLHELSTMITQIMTFQGFIKSYYTEYIVNYDFKVLAQFNTEIFQVHFPSMQPTFQSIIQRVEEFKHSKMNNNNVNVADSTELNPLFIDIRKEFTHLLFHLSHQSFNDHIKNAGNAYSAIFVPEFLNFLQHLTFNDSLELLIKQFVDPYEIIWNQKQFLTIFTKYLNNSFPGQPHDNAAAKKSKKSGAGDDLSNEVWNISSNPNYILAFFSPLESVLNNVDGYCLEEMSKIGSHAVTLTNQMLSMISELVVNNIRQLWEFYNKLESQYHPLEAIKRVEKLMDGKHGKSSMEMMMMDASLPGYESEELAEKSIYKFIYLQKFLTFLIKACQMKKKMIVYNQEYHLSNYLKEQVVLFIKNKFVNLFILEMSQPSTNARGSFLASASTDSVENNSSLIMNRFSSTAHKFFYGMKIFQFIYQLLDLNINQLIQSLLVTHLNDFSKIPPMGYGYQTTLNVPQATPVSPTSGGEPSPTSAAMKTPPPNTLIYQVGKWFLNVISAIHSRSSGSANPNNLIWVPYRNIFMNFNKNKNNLSSSNAAKFDQINPASNNFCIELYLNHEELVYLFNFIGINGYKVIENMLMKQITDQVRYLPSFSFSFLMFSFSCSDCSLNIL